MKIRGRLVDIFLKEIYFAEIVVSNGRIAEIRRMKSGKDGFIIPGLIDSHIHIESSMLTPSSFGYAAVEHGTTSVISDPHEIANVLGMPGIKYMIEESRRSPVRFFFGAPSCVPATSFESNGATVSSQDVKALLENPEIRYLSEVMNFPGVINNDKELLEKINSARKLNKPVDGHAPGLSGSDLKKYVNAGISTDHECSSEEEALEKIALGMKILIREGSAARNLDDLKNLYRINPEMIMLCSDDLHPEMLGKGHINKLIGKLISEGYDTFDVIQSATLNPVMHYGIDAGLLRQGDLADFIVVDSLEKMNVITTYIGGKMVFNNGRRYFRRRKGGVINNFVSSKISIKDIRVYKKSAIARVISAVDGQLLTGEIQVALKGVKVAGADTERDILKIVVKDRYKDGPPAVGFIKGFGLKRGAFAGSVSHDSHNIVAVGTNDRDIVSAVNKIVKHKGGLTVSAGGMIKTLKLDVAGIMSSKPCGEVAGLYEELNKILKELGCTMGSPFMTLSFMSLLVIPDLKIGDKGLFDVRSFSPVGLFV